MWKVGGIKIESAAGRQKKNASGDGISWKREIFCKSLRTRKFSMGKFFGASTHGILTHSGFRQYSRLGWPSLRFEVTAAQSEVKGQKPEVLQKIRGVTDQSHSANFRPKGLKLNQHGLQVYEFRLIQFQTSRTKIGGVILIRNTEIASPPTPLCHTYSEPSG